MTASSAHPDWKAILDAVERRGVPDPTVERHLAECPPCRETAEAARALLAGLDRARLPEPPPAWVERAVERVRAEAAGRASAWDRIRERVARGLREVTAGLAADSLVPSTAVRGTADASPRLLLYETERFAISVSLTPGPEPGERDLLGQVTPRSGRQLPGNGRALLHGAGEVMEVTLTEFGEFSYRGIPAGPVSLALALGSELIRVGPFEAPSPGPAED